MPADLVAAPAGLLLAGSWICLTWIAGYGLAERLGSGSGSERVCVAIVFALALAALQFSVLVEVGLFTRAAVTACCALSGGVFLSVPSLRRRLRGAAGDDWGRLRAAWAELRPWWIRVPLLAAGAVVGLRAARALVSPPLATDSLTYHLFRAGRWVQTGERVLEQAPDAWGYYAYYPHLGDGLTAWLMLPTSSDALVGVAGTAMIGAAFVGTYVAARGLGSARREAALAGATVATFPAVLVFANVAYVDNLVLGAYILGLGSLVALARGGSPRLVLPAALAFELAAGTKTTGIPLLLAGGACIVAVLIARRREDRAIVAGSSALAVAGALALPLVLAAYGPGWVDHGNPLYPFSLGLGGRVWLPGNEENDLLQRAAFAPPELAVFRPRDFLATLFLPRLRAGVQHMNLGPIAPLWPIVAALALPERLRRSWPIGAFMVVVVGLFVMELASSSGLAHRTFAAPAVGRFLSVPVATLVVFAAGGRPRLVATLATASILVGAALSLPRGVSDDEWPAVLAVLGFAAAVLLMMRLLRRRRAAWRLAGAGLVALVACVALPTLRAQQRYRVYAAAVAAEAFDPHPTDERVARAWPIWRHLDGEPSRIAFAAGWDRRGHNWYRAPLLGSRLQNSVVYLPITRDGRVIDYRLEEELRPQAHLPAWLDRMLASEIDYLVLGRPRTLERDWALSLPEIFDLLAREGDNTLFRVDRAALRARVGAARDRPAARTH